MSESFRQFKLRPDKPGRSLRIDEQTSIDDIEVERYELFEAPNYNFHFDRRDFIKAFGLGIVFIVPATRALAQQRGQSESGRGGFNENLPNDIDAWIHIDEKGEVTAFTGKVEVGQNIRTR
jgi:nicotinate dehydrogenase subunit B